MIPWKDLFGTLKAKKSNGKMWSLLGSAPHEIEILKSSIPELQSNKTVKI